MYTLTFAPPDGSVVTFILNVWAPWLATPSATVVATSTWGQALGPATKSPQALINDVDERGVGATQVEATPFKLKASNSTAPFENWNFTALSKPTAPTVILFEPSVNACAGPKKELPLAVVLNTLTFAPPDGNVVTFMVNVWAPWLAAPSATVVATSTLVHVAFGPATKSLHALIKDVDWANTLNELTVNTANSKSVLIFFNSCPEGEQSLVEIKFIIHFFG